MDIRTLLDQVHDLTDLELAVLLSLVAHQNCLITTEDDLIDDLTAELALIVSEVFKLSYTVVSSEDQHSVEKFGEAILDQSHNQDFGQNNQSSDGLLEPHSRLASVHIRAASVAPSHASQLNIDTRTVANVVIAKNFNHASRDVQIAALELSTRRRIYSRTTVHQVPKRFLFIPLVAESSKHIRLNEHLNDRISISHHHDRADGFANLEELGGKSVIARDGDDNSDTASNHDKKSTYSNPHLKQHAEDVQATRHISRITIDRLREIGQSTTMTPEIRRYIQDIIVFLRMRRGVDGGVTPFATTQFVNLAKYLAPLHGVSFVTPSLIALAVRKVYPHRIIIASPERERSMQWGSDMEVVDDNLKNLTPDKVVEEVLRTVKCPI